ncbi:MAG TPA: sensor histidine kinase, partial [Chitinophagaceae bacterium]|nr:sensor histidine kinase [Chitinophagaceae bacterium]
ETYIKTALFYLSKSNLQAASLFVKKAMSDTSQSVNSYAEKKDMFLKLDSIAGNNKPTMAGRSAWRFNDYYILFKSLADADKNTGQRKKFDELTIKYAEEKKENDIKLLQKEKHLQEAMLLQAKYTRNWILGGVGLLLIIVGLLVYNSRLKQRTNKKLKTQRLEIEKQNIRLQHLVDEKDWLVKEIHHRVKNNLQIVMSLLNSQSTFIDNQPALAAIHDSQHRVHAMSLIHQKLYTSENVTSIDMSVYIREMVSYLSESFDTGQHIKFEFNIEPVEMDVSQSVPLGLILNEAITNALKYAFPEGKTGVISISLSQMDANRCVLTVSDNGVGIPARLKNRKGSLGMSLMTGLSEDLDGEFSIESKNGTAIKVLFVHDQSIKKPERFNAPFLTRNQMATKHNII